MRPASQARLHSLLALLWLVAPGCLPAFTALQRPTTLEPGQVQVGVAVGALAIEGRPFQQPGSTPDPSEPVKHWTEQLVPNAELAVRRGLVTNVDAGLRVWVAGMGVAADVKWRFLQTENLQFAVAPALGIDLFALMGAAQSNSSNAAAFSAYLPLFVGIRTGAHELLLGARLVGALYAFQSGSSSAAVPLLVPGGFVGYDLQVAPWLHVVPEVDAYCTPAGSGCLFTAAVAFWFP